MRSLLAKPSADLRFYDNTLRDGEQAPGVWFSPTQKVEIAKLLCDLGIDFLSVGFPAVGRHERQAIESVLRAVPPERTVGLARCCEADIQLVADAGIPCVSLFYPGSEILRRAKSKYLRNDELDALIVSCCRFARSLGMSVLFAFEDMLRCEIDWVVDRYKRYLPVVDAFGLTDTIGTGTPRVIDEYTRALLPLDRPIVTHFHNDMGLATANTLAAIESGAQIAGTTVSGIGERAGNASLEETAVAVSRLLGKKHGVQLSRLAGASEFVQRESGILLDPLRPIVGKHAFVHESGIHIDSLLRDERSYQAIAPTAVGRKMQFVLGKHSSKRAICWFLESNGLDASAGAIEQAREIIESALEHGVVHIEEALRRSLGLPT